MQNPLEMQPQQAEKHLVKYSFNTFKNMDKIEVK